MRKIVRYIGRREAAEQKTEELCGSAMPDDAEKRLLRRLAAPVEPIR